MASVQDLNRSLDSASGGGTRSMSPNQPRASSSPAPFYDSFPAGSFTVEEEPLTELRSTVSELELRLMRLEGGGGGGDGGGGGGGYGFAPGQAGGGGGMSQAPLPSRSGRPGSAPNGGADPSSSASLPGGLSSTIRQINGTLTQLSRVLTGDQEDELIKEMNESCVVLQARMRGHMVRSRYAAALKSLRHWRRRRGVALRREFVLANRRHEAIMSKVDLLCLGRGMRALASVFQGLRQITDQMRPLREANETKAAVHLKRKLQE